MINPIETINDIEEIIRAFHKIESKMLAGQFIPAYRDIKRLMAFFEDRKKAIIKSTKQDISK